MKRLLAVPLLAGCLAAHADSPQVDVLFVHGGAPVVGEIIDVKDGKYWVLLEDGRMTSVPLAHVDRVEKRDRDIAPATTALPDYDRPADTPHLAESRYVPPPERQDPKAGAIGGGFEVGLSEGGRLRFHIESPAIDHVDVRLRSLLLFTSYLQVGLSGGGEIAFFGKSPVHLALTVDTGVAAGYGLYPFVGVGGVMQYDPKGPFEVAGGATVGTLGGSMALVPELSASWVW